MAKRPKKSGKKLTLKKKTLKDLSPKKGSPKGGALLLSLIEPLQVSSLYPPYSPVRPDLRSPLKSDLGF